MTTLYKVTGKDGESVHGGTRRAGRWSGHTLEERFWMKVDRGPGCWVWRGATDRKGYGKIKVSRSEYALAHRLSYRIAFGAPDDGLCVLHHCDNPPCVNPAHLFLGTIQANNADMFAKGRHARGTTAPNRRLSPDEVLDIRARYRHREHGYGKLAAEFGVSRSTVRAVVGRKSWGHLP